MLVETDPDGPLTREELAGTTGYEAGGGRFVNLVGSLKSLGLVGYPSRGLVQAEPVVFLS